MASIYSRRTSGITVGFLCWLMLAASFLPSVANALVTERRRSRFAATTTTITTAATTRDRNIHRQQQRCPSPRSGSSCPPPGDEVVPSSSSALHASAKRKYRRSSYEGYEGDNGSDALSRERSASTVRPTKVSNDRPTETMTQRPDPPTVPEKPVIVVLGASGKVGRLVVRQLLEKSHLDITVIAFCRNYDKACRVLYDDMVVLNSRRKKRGPKLQIIEADLVPAEELPGYRDEEELEWFRRATSAAEFYNTQTGDYDNRGDNDANIIDSNEALEEAIKQCTTIISCVGSVRPTNVWTDILARPLWRLLRKDVSSWCNDKRHPFYTNYVTTRKALAFAEREQLRREAAILLATQQDNEQQQQHQEHQHEQNRKNKQPKIDNDNDDDSVEGTDLVDGDEVDTTVTTIPRIRFIRISDLCVAQKPWHFVPLITNMFQSMVFRYQDMAEQMLEASALVETVVIRPGDLVDDERDVNTTSIQIGHDGTVPTPSIVGRDDVAQVVVAAALFDSDIAKKSPNNKNGKMKHKGGIDRNEHEKDGTDRQSASSSQLPFHYTFGVRWSGEDMHPYPSQGCMSDGLPDAQLSLQAAIRRLRKQQQQSKRRKQLVAAKKNANALNKAILAIGNNNKNNEMDSIPSSTSSYHETVLRFARSIPSATSARMMQRSKPYGICVAIPVYLILTLMARTLIMSLLPLIPLKAYSWTVPIAERTARFFTTIGALILARINHFLHGFNMQQFLVSIIPRRNAHKYINF